MRERLEAIGISPLASLGEIIALFGIWTQHVWIFWVNTNNPCLPTWFPWQVIYLIISCCMLAGGVLVARRGGIAQSTAFALDWLSATIGCAGAVCILLSLHAGAGSGKLSIAGLVVSGLAFGWTNLRWGELYARFDIRQAIAFLFVGGILAAAGKTVLFLSPLMPSAVVAAVLPLASVAWFRQGLASTRAGASAATSLGASTALGSMASLGASPEVVAVEGPKKESASGFRAKTVLACSPRPPAFFPRQSLWALWKVALVFVAFSVVNSSMLALLVPSESIGTTPVFLAER